MSHRRVGTVASADDKLPPLPLDAFTWRSIANSMGLSPQQARIVELILRNQQDKAIAASMKLSVATVRTYLRRIFDRVGVEDRLSLILHIFALAQQGKTTSNCRP